jgi:hypothetical protein
MHESGEKAPLEIRQVQGGKFFAALKPVLINRAFIVTQKMTGHPVHDHQPIAPFFKVLLVERIAALVQVRRQVIRLLIRDQHHQAFAAIAAVDTTDPWRNTFAEPRNHPVNLLAVVLLHKTPETVVFIGMAGRKSGDQGKIGLDMWFFGFDFSKLTFRRLIMNEIQVFNRFIHILLGFVEK